MDRRFFLKLALVTAAVQSRMCARAGIRPIKTALRNMNRSTVMARRGMVCSSQPLASMAGVDMLKKGGNAVDAALAANAVLSVTEPMSCGPGGDLFAMVWIEKEHVLFGLNASGRSPYNWSLAEAEALGLKEIPIYGPLSWSVPGCVSGWGALNGRFGRLPLSDVLEPAIIHAREGFPVTPVIAGHWQSVDAVSHPGLARVYAPSGRIPISGDLFRNPEVAQFLETIAREGAGSFYHGEIADKIVKFSEENGGRFTRRDFEDHVVSWVDPVCSRYRDFDVWELPPNGQGIAALQILNILENFDIPSLEPNSARHLHLFIEAKKLAFEDRASYYADPDFARIPIEELISKEYAAKRAALINPQRAAQTVRPGVIPSSGDTVYLAAADADGNMISLIQSIYYNFGSQMVPADLGFALQNRGHLFSLDPGHPNRLEPHKRPFHTIIPAFATQKNEPRFAFGVMGGDFQPQGHAQILMNRLDFGLSIQQAGEQPRVAHLNSSTPTGEIMKYGGTVGFELGIPERTKVELAGMGHSLEPGLGRYGGYQGIWRESNPIRYFGGSDPRKDGCAMGF